MNYSFSQSRRFKVEVTAAQYVLPRFFFSSTNSQSSIMPEQTFTCFFNENLMLTIVDHTLTNVERNHVFDLKCLLILMFYLRHMLSRSAASFQSFEKSFLKFFFF